MSYRQFQIDITPSPLRGPSGQAWAGELGGAKDALVARARDAVKAGWVERAPSDAVPLLSLDARIERAPGEAEASWRDRIRSAFDSWSWLGTRYGITLAVGLLGYGYPAVVTQGELPIDTDVTRWARLRLIFTGRAMWGPSPWGALVGVARQVQFIESADPAVARPQLRRVTRTWINARDRVATIVIARGARLWGRVVWGSFVWGDGPGIIVWGPPAFGSAEARWGAFAWGVFC